MKRIITINSNQVRFITETGATGKKQIRNVKVTRATTLSAPSSVDMGEVKIGKSISAQVNVSFNNTTYNLYQGKSYPFSYKKHPFC